MEPKHKLGKIVPNNNHFSIPSHKEENAQLLQQVAHNYEHIISNAHNQLTHNNNHRTTNTTQSMAHTNNNRLFTGTSLMNTPNNNNNNITSNNNNNGMTSAQSLPLLGSQTIQTPDFYHNNHNSTTANVNNKLLLSSSGSLSSSLSSSQQPTPLHTGQSRLTLMQIQQESLMLGGGFMGAGSDSEFNSVHFAPLVPVSGGGEGGGGGIKSKGKVKNNNMRLNPL
jgi:hypothetical protein